MRYDGEGKNYLLYDDEDRLIYKGDKVAFLFCPSNDPDCWEILAHGDPSFVQARYEILKEEYVNAGLEDIANSLYKVCYNFCYINELNTCLEISGYIRIFLHLQNEDLNQFKCYAKNGFESVEIRKLKDKTEAFHNSNHNEFTYWGSCKEEPCATNALKIVNLDGNNIKYKKG